MNSQLLAPIVIVAAALALVGAAVTSNIPIFLQQAFADPPGEDGKKGGPKDEVNNGQCKEEFNENVCKKFHTGSD
jgi:hypothetical protein